MKTTNQEKLQNYILDQVFSERPGNQTDWIDFMISNETQEVPGFTPCQEYELDNCEALRNILSAKLKEAYEITELLKEGSPGGFIQAEVVHDTIIAGISVKDDVFDSEHVEYRLIETEE